MEGAGGHLQRAGRSTGDGLEPSRDGVRLLARVLGDDEMAFVPVGESADLGNVPVVEAEGADSAPLERRVQAAEVLPHPVGEHLRLSGHVHEAAVIAVGRPKSARRHRSSAATKYETCAML